MALRTASTAAELQALSSSLAAVHFWAEWCEPCKHLDALFAELAKEHPSVTFVRVEAEAADELCEAHGVTSVPFFLFLRGGQVAGKVEGADAEAVTARVRQLASPAAQPPPAPAAAVPPVPVDERIRTLLASHHVMLFMKGTPDAPKCGFSRRVVEALRKADVPFGSFNILADEDIRQGLKVYSDWPTYPQLYAGAELLGGCDIVEEMATKGELAAACQPAKAA